MQAQPGSHVIVTYNISHTHAERLQRLKNEQRELEILQLREQVVKLQTVSQHSSHLVAPLLTTCLSFHFS